MSEYSPPRFAVKFLRWFCHPKLIDRIEGDLFEEYLIRIGEQGKRRADLQFVIDVFTLFRRDIIRPLEGIGTLNSFGMIQSYFKIGWRNILRSKGYSFLNISGLAIGLTAAILILLWVQNETSYDKFHANADRTYQLFSRDMNNGKLDVWSYTPALMAPELKQSYPEVEEAVRQRVVFFLLKAGENRFNDMGAFADPGFLRMFSFPILRGSAKALEDENGIVLVHSMAIKLFGTADCLGQTVLVNDGDNFKVTAVLEDLPHNTSFEKFNYLLPWAYFTRLGWDQGQTWATTNAGTYVTLKSERDAAAFDLKINGLVKKNVKEGDGSTREMFIHPLTKLHLYSKAENGQLTGGLHETVTMFSIIAGLIVLIACINFINLSTARSEKRAREVGVRKIAGALKRSLVIQFLVESTLLVLFAFVIALLLVNLSLPLFNLVLHTTLKFEFIQFQFWIYTLAILLFTGIMAGGYPAFFLASFQPIKALKGARSSVSFINPRKVLVVVQFTAAIVLCICSVMVQRQIQFAENRTTGYNPKYLHYEFLQGEIPLHFEAIKTELLASGAVTSVTRSFSPIVWPWDVVTGFTWQGSDGPDKTLNFVGYGADAGMSQTFEMEILQGRDLDIFAYPTDTSAVVLNESAVKLMRLANPVGEIIQDGQSKSWQVVGVVKDFIAQSPYRNVNPMIIFGWQNRYGVINYRFNSANSETDNRQKVEAVFKRHNPEYPFECNSAEEYYRRKFEQERQTGKLASGFAALSIVVSCLGLFGLASYLAESRTKEIGVRKVLGASVLRIVTMLSISFIKLVAVAIIIASPLAWYFASRWLESYEYRVPLGPGIFLVAGAAAVLIALITVSVQAVRAAVANPVRSLRSE